MSHRWYVNNKHQAKQFCEWIMENQDKGLYYEIIQPKRTPNQNNAIHAYCRELAEVMAAHGVDMRTALKDGVVIEPTMEIVKNKMWVPVQEALFGKEHTSDLAPHEVNIGYERLSKHVAEKWSINVPFGRRN